jgi:hypothetical protein
MAAILSGRPAGSSWKWKPRRNLIGNRSPGMSPLDPLLSNHFHLRVLFERGAPPSFAITPVPNVAL